MAEKEGLFTVRQASNYLNCRVKTVYQWVSQRKLKNIKLGGLLRFRQEDLDEFIQKNVRESIKK